jgi:hypothetical protein
VDGVAGVSGMEGMYVLQDATIIVEADEDMSRHGFAVIGSIQAGVTFSPLAKKPEDFTLAADSLVV